MFQNNNLYSCKLNNLKENEDEMKINENSCKSEFLFLSERMFMFHKKTEKIRFEYIPLFTKMNYIELCTVKG